MDPKRRLFTQFARVGKAIASPHRLELIELLAQGERPVDALARALGVPIANASHHLRTLRAAGLVESRRQGTFVFYRLADPSAFELARTARSLAERHLKEVDRLVSAYYRTRDALEAVSREELLRRAQAAEVVVLDVRPAEEYRAGHVAGALSVPLSELERRLSAVPRGKTVVAYCRGPYCLLAFRAVELLRNRGWEARRLADGFPEWRAAGFPIESTNPEVAP